MIRLLWKLVWYRWAHNYKIVRVRNWRTALVDIPDRRFPKSFSRQTITPYIKWLDGDV